MKNNLRGNTRPIITPVVIALALPLMAMPAKPILANRLGENSAWQFDTTADKANKAAVLDMMERKKGGYYDGFTTVYNSTTNIGTQINCSNSASATGNVAQNGQTGNSTSATSGTTVNSDATGNDSTEASGDGDGANSTDQTNSGSVDSDVLNSPSNSDTSVSDLSGSDQDLTNDQDNSGDQTATVADSTACTMSGANLTGDVTFNDQSVASGALN